MIQSLNIKDLFLRLLVVFLTSLVLLFATRENSFDLLFQIRKAQPTWDSILLVELPEDTEVEKAILYLKEKNVERIFVTQFLYDQSSPLTTPYIVGENHDNYLSLSVKPDTDGLIRHCEILNFPDLNIVTTEKKIINFRGPENTFPTLSYLDLLANKISMKNKWVIIKNAKPINTYTTPIGLLSEAELVATIIDNTQASRFIKSKNFTSAVIILLLLLVLATITLIYLPSTLALITCLIMIISYTSLSLWTFDYFYFWTPITISAIQILLTFLLISNYKFVLNEKTRWSLEKESLFLGQVEEMKTNFLSLFSHDLKTPLAKIIGIVDTLQSQTKDPATLTELDKILQSSKELEKYIKRILKMSQVQSKNISLNKESVDLNNIIDQAVQQNIHLAQTKNILIEKNLEPLFMINIDAALIKEVIINLIENAITYSPENSKVLVSSEEVNDFIKVSVRDQGQGIPKSFQDNIWEKAYRFDTSKSGYGLGLFLSRYVIQLHGGQVYLNSQENKGSEFGFLIPINEDQEHETT